MADGTIRAFVEVWNEAEEAYDAVPVLADYTFWPAVRGLRDSLYVPLEPDEAAWCEVDPATVRHAETGERIEADEYEIKTMSRLAWTDHEGRVADAMV